MKKTIIAIFFLLFTAAAGWAQNEVTVSKTEGIVWETDFKKAQAAARASGRPLLLDFTAPWCGPCKAMDREFWVREDVIQALKPFIAVKVDYDKDTSVVNKYNVLAIPHVAFTDPLGNLITFRRGFSKKNINELNTILDQMPKDFSPMLKYYDALDRKKDDGNALYQIAGAYRGAKMLTLSSDFYKKALKTPEIETDAEKQTNAYLSLGANYLTLQEYVAAVDILEDFLKTKPAGESREAALYFLTLGSANGAKFKDATKYLQMLKTDFPGSKFIAKAETALETAKNQPKKKD